MAQRCVSRAVAPAIAHVGAAVVPKVVPRMNGDDALPVVRKDQYCAVAAGSSPIVVIAWVRGPHGGGIGGVGTKPLLPYPRA